MSSSTIETRVVVAINVQVTEDTLSATIGAMNPVYTDSYGVFGWDAVTVSADVTQISFDTPSITNVVATSSCESSKVGSSSGGSSRTAGDSHLASFAHRLADAGERLGQIERGIHSIEKESHGFLVAGPFGIEAQRQR